MPRRRPAAWTEWRVPLSDLTGVNLAAVKKITIGVGDKASPKAGGAGMLFLDDIGYGHARFLAQSPSVTRPVRRVAIVITPERGPSPDKGPVSFSVGRQPRRRGSSCGLEGYHLPGNRWCPCLNLPAQTADKKKVHRQKRGCSRRF